MEILFVKKNILHDLLSSLNAVISTNERHCVVSRGGRDRFVGDEELESDNRSPLISRSNPVAATFAFSAKRDFRRLHPRVIERITLA